MSWDRSRGVSLRSTVSLSCDTLLQTHIELTRTLHASASSVAAAPTTISRSLLAHLLLSTTCARLASA